MSSITTTAGETFTHEESVALAQQVHRRFGHDSAAAHAAWCRMLQNNCSLLQFMALVENRPRPIVYVHVILTEHQLGIVSEIVRLRFEQYERAVHEFIAEGATAHTPKLQLARDAMGVWETILNECRFAADRLASQSGTGG